MAPATWVAVLFLCFGEPLGRATGGPASNEPFQRIDATIEEFMDRWHLPGCSFALSQKGRIVLQRGYGVADLGTRESVGVNHLFRIASLSKPITAVGILKLIEQGRLHLDDHAFGADGVLNNEEYTQIRDPRVARITIRNLLEHRGGWDRNANFDPVWKTEMIARKMGVAQPIAPTKVIEYMLRYRELDFDPGTRYAYSNFGYCVLGRIIEKLGGRPYARWIKEALLSPLGISDMHSGGDNLDSRRANEVKYYTWTDSDQEHTHDSCYGWNIGVSDASGGWIASATDLVRFVTALNQEHRPGAAPLDSDSLTMMLERPSASGKGAIYYAKGWEVEGPYFWHTGAMPGSYGVLAHLKGGICYAILFNGRADPEHFLDDFALPLRTAIEKDLAASARRSGKGEGGPESAQRPPRGEDASLFRSGLVRRNPAMGSSNSP